MDAVTLVAIRAEMKVRLDTIAGLSAHANMPSSLGDKDLAAVLPGNPVLEPDGHGGAAFVNLRVFIRCQRGRVKESQLALDEYLWPTGTNSIAAAVLGDKTLDGEVHDIRFTGVTQYAGDENTFGVSAEVLFTARAQP